MKIILKHASIPSEHGTTLVVLENDTEQSRFEISTYFSGPRDILGKLSGRWTDIVEIDQALEFFRRVSQLAQQELTDD